MVKRNNNIKSSRYYFVLCLSKLRLIVAILLFILAVFNCFIFKNSMISGIIAGGSFVLILGNIYQSILIRKD